MSPWRHRSAVARSRRTPSSSVHTDSTAAARAKRSAGSRGPRRSSPSAYDLHGIHQRCLELPVRGSVGGGFRPQDQIEVRRPRLKGRQDLRPRELREATAHAIARDRGPPVARRHDPDSRPTGGRGDEEHVHEPPTSAVPLPHRAADVATLSEPRRPGKAEAPARAGPASGFVACCACCGAGH